MKITEKEVLHVANLARLNLSKEDTQKLTYEMGNIIDFADKLNELDTEGIIASAHAVSVDNVFREDEVKPSFDREDMLQNAPTKQDGCFKVPNIIE